MKIFTGQNLLEMVFQIKFEISCSAELSMKKKFISMGPDCTERAV